VPQIPLVEELANGPILPGSNVLVEFDPSSQWYAASVTIAAGWLKTGGTVTYITATQPPNNIRSRLTRLGLDPGEFEKREKLQFFDWYTLTLGQKSDETPSANTLKVHELSIEFGKELKSPELVPNHLRIWDNGSVLARFNEEKGWIEFELTRLIPRALALKSTRIMGIISGVHSEWAYKQLESAVDCILDFKLEESKGELRDLVRVRTLRSMEVDRRWHQLHVLDDGKIELLD
jgi:KaiC/GvpD/RAD55 family RecA-like ATPase